jgi:hypothetical protein
MEYLKVRWIHEYPDEPILLYSEFDGEGWQVRKTEVFRDGRIGRASKLQATGGSMLGVDPMESLAEINSQPQFQAANISESEFELARRARDGAALPS